MKREDYFIIEGDFAIDTKDIEKNYAISYFTDSRKNWTSIRNALIRMLQANVLSLVNEYDNINVKQICEWGEDDPNNTDNNGYVIEYGNRKRELRIFHKQ